MKLLHLFEKFTHAVAHLSVPKLSIIFGFTIAGSLLVAFIPHPAKLTRVLPAHNQQNRPIPPPNSGEATNSPVLSQSISSAEFTPVAPKEVGLSLGETILGAIDMSWSSIQSQSPNQYDWSRFDRLVTAANAQGFKILPILAYTPSWARPAGCSSEQCAPADINRFAQFASVATSRYKSQQVHTWEIWNEPNMRGFWRPNPDPAVYVNLLKATTLAIRTSDPKATIVSGSLGSTDSSGGIPQLQFLQGLYDNGGQPYFDAVGFHPYSFPVLPTDYHDWNAWSQMHQTPVSVHSVMLAHGDVAKSIWITEFGAPTGGPGMAATAANYNLDAAPDHVDEILQSKMISLALADYKSSDSLGKFFWYSYQDQGTSSSTAENFYGLRHANGSPKPAYQAFKDAVASLKN